MIPGHNPDRIRRFSGYTFLSGYKRFLADSWRKSMEKPAKILILLVRILSGSDDLVATRFFQDISVSWLIPGEKSMEKLARILTLLVRILSGSDDLVATRFSQENAVSSGKSSVSLKDPDRILEGSGTETSKIFTRAMVS